MDAENFLHGGLGESLNKDLDLPIGKLQHPHDQGHRPDAIEIFRGGIFFGKVFLSHEKDEAVFRQGLLQGLDRFLPGDKQGKNHVRKDDDVPHRDQGKCFGKVENVFFKFFFSYRLQNGLDEVRVVEDPSNKGKDDHLSARAFNDLSPHDLLPWSNPLL